MGNRAKKNDESIGLIADRPYWMTYVSIVARAVHQVGAAVFLAYFLLNSGGPSPNGYLILASISGILLLAVEAVRHRQFLREPFGLVTIGKLLIIGPAFHGWIPAAPAILFAFFIASLVSHAPKKIRHRVLF